MVSGGRASDRRRRSAAVSGRAGGGKKKSNFGKFHPGGNLGKDLVMLEEIMHDISELPIVNFNDSMGKTLITMTIKGFGCVGVVNKSKKLVGIITDEISSDNRKKALKTFKTYRTENTQHRTKWKVYNSKSPL